MSQRCTVRLPDTLYEFLQIEAEARQCGVSDLIRQGLERLLGLEADHGAEHPKAAEPVASSTPALHDCTDAVLARLPGDVREVIVERARVLELSTFQVLRALLLAQLPPSQPAPQVSDTARPQKEFITWQEFKRQRQQASETAPAGTALSPAVLAPWISPSDTDARPAAPSPAALGV